MADPGRDTAAEENRIDYARLFAALVREQEWDVLGMDELEVRYALCDIADGLAAALDSLLAERDEAHAKWEREVKRGYQSLCVEEELRARAVAAEREAATLREALRDLAETANWYRRCLEGVIDRVPVRDLDQARVAYDNAYAAALASVSVPEKQP